MNSVTIRKEKNNSITEYISNNINIEDVLFKLNLTEFEKVGNEYCGPCPTGHTSKSRKSFHIVPEKNFFYCHNCHQAGDSISLVMLEKGYRFPEAVRWIIDNFQIKDYYCTDFTAYTTNNPDDGMLYLKGIFLEDLVELGKKMLFEEEGREVLQYLTEKRGYNEDLLKNSEFIFLPETSEIKKYLSVKHPDMVQYVNLIKLNGFYGDNFRLGIPYRNQNGLITGILKRSIKPEGESIQTLDGKTVNNVRWDSTTGTKKDNLFGIHNIKNEETVLIVEGYPDAAYFPALGFKNIVALGQGVLGVAHVESLKQRKVKNVILSLDNDGVGAENSIKAVIRLLEFSDIIPFILDPKLLSPHKDPDEYVRANGIEKFREVVMQAESAEKWIINRLLDNYEKLPDIQKQNKLKEVFTFGAKFRSAFMVSNFISAVAEKTDSTKQLIQSSLKDAKRSSSRKSIRIDNTKRYFPFIESSTSSYSYYDKMEDDLHLGVSKDILEQILNSADQELPNDFNVLKAVFNVKSNKKIDLENEIFNLFTPTEFMLLEKTEEKISPRSFTKIHLLLSNLIPKYQERKRFLNWLAGILQTREKQQTAWVFKGSQGSGKGVLLEYVLKPLLGRRQAVKVEDEQLKAQFNGYLQNVVLIAFNEVANTSNGDRNSVKNKVKALITDKEIQINEKQVRAFFVDNYVNALFYSNEGIPVVLEENDRRFNIIQTGDNLRKQPWFENPEEFLEGIKDELFSFGQFLMNWRYDAILAKTPIDNTEKAAIVNVCKDRFEEFVLKLKQQDVDWLNEAQDTELDFERLPVYAFHLADNRIEKDLATRLFNKINPESKIKKETLSKKLQVHGIRAVRDRKTNKNYYEW